MKNEESIKLAVEKLFAGDVSGHDYFHTLRVYKNAMKIAKMESCNKDVVRLGALLHDVDDEKLFTTTDYANARSIMAEAEIDADIVDAVIEVIRTVSYKGSEETVPTTIEGKIVQDADRLDAIGAVGIARAFAYGGSRGRVMFDPKISPRLHMDAQTYRQAEGTTINHFYEKLLLLRDLMNTDAAKQIASERHKFMETYLQEFMKEWEGE